MLLTPNDLATFVAVHAPGARLLRNLGDTPTVPAAAAALGVAPDQIIKTLLFVVRPQSVGDDPRLIVVISHGERRVDKALLAAYVGVGKKGVSLAPAPLVLERTGYAAGGVPPFGHATPLPVLLDEAVLAAAARFDGHLYGGGGDNHTMLRLSLDDLLRISAPTVLPLSVP
jgi:prolyl-tRNA editing enzyme YbaK/EbsC (Cys-tRNA(Pro) deacylase)